MVMCHFCASTRPDQEVLPAEHNKKPGGKYLPHCNKKVCTDTARGVPRPERPRRERDHPQKRQAIHDEAGGSLLSELASSALLDWEQDPGQIVDALISLRVMQPTWSGLPPELALHVLNSLPLVSIRAVSVCSKEDSRRASVAWSRRCPAGWLSSLTQGDYDISATPISEHTEVTTHAGLLAIASGTSVLFDTTVDSGYGGFELPWIRATVDSPTGVLPRGVGLSWVPVHDGKIQILSPSGPLGIYRYPSGRSECWPSSKIERPHLFPGSFYFPGTMETSDRIVPCTAGRSRSPRRASRSIWWLRIVVRWKVATLSGAPRPARPPPPH